MSIRPAGVDAPAVQTPVAESAPTAPATPVANPKESGGLAKGPRDGVDAQRTSATEAALTGQQLTTPEAKTLTGAVGVADVLRELTGSPIAGDPGLRSLPAGIQDRILNAIKNGPPGLAETFKRLANSPTFRKLSPDVQAKVVDLLAKVAANPKESQAIERLVRSPAFAALPEKEQTKMLASINKANEGQEAREKTAEPSSSRNGPGNLGIGGEASAAAALLATIVDPSVVPQGGSSDPVPVDPNAGRGGRSDDGPAGSPYREIKRLIEKLRAAPELSPQSVGHVLGSILAPAAKSPAGNGLWIAYEGHPAGGPFQRVELRESTTLPWRLVNLEVRPDIEVSYHEFRDDLIPVSIPPHLNPDIAPDGELSFRVTDERPKQDVRFGFGARIQHLRSASIHRHFG